MNLPTVNGANARVAVWSQLGDRQPAYALVANVDLVVIRFDDQVAVMYGRCHHRGALLADGYVDGRNLSCGVHSWDYRYDTGVSEYNNDEALQRFGAVVDEEADVVWVNEADVAAFAEAHPQPYRRERIPGLVPGRARGPGGTAQQRHPGPRARRAIQARSPRSDVGDGGPAHRATALRRPVTAHCAVGQTPRVR